MKIILITKNYPFVTCSKHYQCYNYTFVMNNKRWKNLYSARINRLDKMKDNPNKKSKEVQFNLINIRANEILLDQKTIKSTIEE